MGSLPGRAEPEVDCLGDDRRDGAEVFTRRSKARREMPDDASAGVAFGVETWFSHPRSCGRDSEGDGRMSLADKQP
jgi:hypothetical protein